MTEGRAITVERYARRVAAEWERLTGRAVILSEREWRLLVDWHTRGVPLALLDEAMRDACERRSGPPRSLAWIGAAVEESWAAMLDGRASAGADRVPTPRDLWRSCRERDSDGPLGRVLGDLLDAIDHGTASPATVDAELDDRLVDIAPEGTVRRLAEDVDRRLQSFRTRLDEATLTHTRRRALVEGLRRELRLPRLTGTVRAG